ncbi:uncharacterized protein CTRU02_211178 [Colletotrichum truncatum]|uniref:Uncharacterized protein n=1 Tax=Colletotrichum truncatum TaxID=5467 RepID=A0ACC3YR19_COLTU|nr:uncharacterized protein CTRU02_01959 [Colletotrichum truncatum]KAF6799088.1 hypothetical protein CTRU02_01959 [Colletotrichum truncatum]
MATKFSKAPFARGCCSQITRRIDPRSRIPQRFYSADRAPEAAETSTPKQEKDEPKKEKGAMTRRLEEATEEALLTGGRAGRRAIEDAGFDQELKEKLLDKVQTAKFRSDFASAFAEAEMPNAAGEGTRTMATAQPWTGEESQSDIVLRMLNDAKKPLKPELRGQYQIPPVDMRIRREPKVNAGQRAANARDRASTYTGMGLKDQNGLSDDEREAMRRELRERFEPAARAMPNTMSGLAALANERIENAIARGQFKNIPRGKGVERDTRADNPFIDTTEYIMNKMIKRQDIVPPWIEKQQELAKVAGAFRARLRNDWKRHVARMIASRGGTLEEQVQRAEEYARAEELHNPRKRNVETITVPTNTTDDIVMVKIRQQAEGEAVQPELGGASTGSSAVLPPPFRDSDWLEGERSYMTLAIENINAITRSYNLMAPDLAKKPYFSLERELAACYADVAPQVAETIRERATRPVKSPFESVNPGPAAMFDRLSAGGKATKIRDSKAPHYGFKEMWRDLWS